MKDRAIDRYARLRLETCRRSLVGNDFEVDLADDRRGAHELVVRDILPAIGPKTMAQTKAFAAPLNALRLAAAHEDRKTPCIGTGACRDRESEFRICNTWTITEKSFPAGRVKVVLINEYLGH